MTLTMAIAHGRNRIIVSREARVNVRLLLLLWLRIILLLVSVTAVDLESHTAHTGWTRPI